MKEKVQIADGYTVGGVTVDMKYYTGADVYSDGSIEDEILAALKEERADKMLHEDNRWAVLYHLSAERENLLSWLDIEKDKTVLEIGCGCGAITGVLARKAKSVDSIEISPRRAEIAAYKNADCDNVTIHVGNLNNMEFTQKFDYVTLIGVLEYAGRFTKGENPYVDFLAKCRSFLKPNGVLIIAIENRLGMKYFSGALEDHTGKLFDGITDYENYSGVKTFSHSELSNVLTEAGFAGGGGVEYFYPYPDYKLPENIYSEQYSPSPAEIAGLHNFNFDLDKLEFFPEQQAMAGICRAGLFKEFSNSFLVLAHNNTDFVPCHTNFVHTSLYRKKEYRIETSIITIDGKKYVKKKALTAAAKKHIKTMVENAAILTKLYGSNHVAQAKLVDEDNALIMEYIEGKSFTDILLNTLKSKGKKAFIEKLKYYYEIICQGQGIAENNISFADDKRKYEFDLNFSNVIIRDDTTFVYIDYEGLLPQVSKQAVLYNAIIILMQQYKDILTAHNITLAELRKDLNIDNKAVNEYEKVRSLMNEYFLDFYWIKYLKKRKVFPISWYWKLIKLIRGYDWWKRLRYR